MKNNLYEIIKNAVEIKPQYRNSSIPISFHKQRQEEDYVEEIIPGITPITSSLNYRQTSYQPRAIRTRTRLADNYSPFCISIR